MQTSSSHEPPLGSPTSPMKGRQSVRKRVVNPSKMSMPRLSNPHINPRLIYNDYYGKSHKNDGPVSMGERLKNFFLVLAMLFFPLSIFVLPMWMHHGKGNPPVLVALRTSQSRLAYIEPLITHLIEEKEVVKVVLVLSGEDDDDGEPNAVELPDFLANLLSAAQGSTTTQVHVMHTNSVTDATLSFVAKMILQGGVETTEPTESEMEGDGKDGNSPLEMKDDIRILILNEETQSSLSSISNLIQWSQQEPDAVIAEVGGSLRSKFRQVKYTSKLPSSLDKPPNMILHSSTIVSESVDVLDSSHGVIFRQGIFVDILPTLKTRLNDLASDVADDTTLQRLAEDMVWSGVLEALNITRRVAPMKYEETIKNNSTSIKYSTGHWTEAAFKLQQKWGIWQDFQFLHWSSLTQGQKDAIACEGKYEQDCESTTVCRPNSDHCSKDIVFGPMLKDFIDSSSGHSTRR